jgi:hypothetical protein
VKFGIVAATAAIACLPAFAATPDPLLDHFAGKWVMTGTIRNHPVTHDVTAEWILQGSYLRLSEISHEKDASGKPQYEAEVLVAFDPTKQHYVCFWYDTTGIPAPDTGTGVAKRDGDTLPFVFRYGGNIFHNTFAWLAASGTWTMAMDDEDKGKLVPFARLTLTKAP